MTKLADRVRELMDQRGLGQSALAERAGLGETAVRDILKGYSKSPREATVRAIAAALGVSVAYLVTGNEDDRPQVPIVGIVSAGEGWLGSDEVTDWIDFAIGGADVVAVEIRGDSMQPAYKSGDILIGRKRSGRTVAECVGKDCIIQVIDGQSYVKILKAGKARGLYTLKSYNPYFDDIESVSVQWVAPVEWIRRK